MKKSVYQIKSIGNSGSIDLEILLDLNRELTETDNFNIRDCVGNLSKLLLEETINVNPNSKIQANAEREQILSLFDGNLIFVEETPNGYCSEYCCKHLPWFIVTTTKGRIKIGWRKQVINIDWSDSIIVETAKVLFENEKVTKGDYYIHADSLDDARKYINVLLSK